MATVHDGQEKDSVTHIELANGVDQLEAGLEGDHALG